jgi:hypothetical protein
VLFVPEPGNRFDPLAIAIKRLNGSKAGYVPRSEQAAYKKGQVYKKEQVRFGRIKAAGDFIPRFEREFNPGYDPDNSKVYARVSSTHSPNTKP